MKKLKIILLFSIIIIFLIRINVKSKYNLKTNKINGTILSINKYETYQKVLLDAKEKIIVYTNENNLKVGDIISIEGVISIPNNNSNFNLFNYKKYLKSQGIYYIFNAKKVKKIKINNSFFYKIRRKIINRIDNNNCSRYLYALVLADSSKLDEDMKEVYKFNGISHLFAISSAHISILLSIIMMFLKKLNVINIFKKIIVLFILFFYLFILDFSVSVGRVVFFYFLKFVLEFINIKISDLKILLIVGALFLLYNPYFIYNPGFLFTFIISLSITIYKKNNLNKKFLNLNISLIAFISSLIIVIQNYHRVNLLCPIYNLVYIPFVTFIIFPSCLITLVFDKFIPLLSFEIQILEKSSIFLKNTFNFASISLSHISILGIIIYLIIIFIIFINIKKGKLYIYVILIPVFLIHHNILRFNPIDMLVVLDVGQGDSILIINKYHSCATLIDTGGKYNKEISKNTLIPFFDSIGVNSINTLIISHGDYDHMGEAINLVNNFKVEKVIFNCGPYNDLEKELIKVLDKKKIKYYSCIKELNIDKNILQFLQTKEYDNENDNSNVIYTELNGYKFMFMGDAGTEKEKDILDKYNISNIDVLKVGHHGSKTSSSKEFINMIKPKYAVISVGKNNRYGHPNKEVLDNLDNSKIYRTDENGSIMFKIKNNKLQVETCSP